MPRPLKICFILFNEFIIYYNNITTTNVKMPLAGDRILASFMSFSATANDNAGVRAGVVMNLHGAGLKPRVTQGLPPQVSEIAPSVVRNCDFISRSSNVLRGNSCGSAP